MDPKEHLKAAEQMLAEAEATPSNYDETSPVAALLTAQAQVHVFLALAADALE
jgi:hypothetical protein